ncbi:MAG: zinc metallopeptidase [Thermoflexales bacterium]|nr:zinc metallopeptidase [Thermoflexales bacterium]
MYFDSSYLCFAIPGLLLALVAQFMVKSAYARYAKVPVERGVNGVEMAKMLMRQTGVQVGVEAIGGELTDHYDPRGKVMRLSDSSRFNSVASVAVVAHEFGHAMQDAEGYGPLKLRGAIVPAVQVSSWVGPILFLVGAGLVGLQTALGASLAWLGVIAFGLAALFSIVTLPVEFDASRRALAMLQATNVMNPDEMSGAKKVLNAAALTYVAAAAQSLLTLLYYVTRLTGRSRD